MKYFLILLSMMLSVSFLFGQYAGGMPEFDLQKETMETHMYYLASDHLEGRYTGSEGGQKAANYIARLFEVYGLEPAPGTEGYFQNIPFNKVVPPAKATIDLAGNDFVHGDNMVVFRGGALNVTTEAVFVGHGWVDAESDVDDYQGLAVKGKVVFMKPGTPDNQNPYEIFQIGAKKMALAKERGAVGVVELFRVNFPWRFFKSYFNKERLETGDEESDDSGQDDLFYAFIQEEKPNPIIDMENGQPLAITLENTGVQSQKIYAPNVVGVLEGSDPALKDEHILISAHYDHVGVGKQGGGAITPQDSIFNGARDNAIGTVALLAAVKSLVQNPPRRSVIFLACTGEEIGLLGSKYYAENPLIPLEKTVFNLNNDGGGYNTTEHISVIGYDLTDISEELEMAARAFDLAVIRDPAPEQGLYERSDNISFARKGIPAIDFAPGVTAMDAEIMKYYHQVSDNPETINFEYLLKYCQAFSHAARLISDRDKRPAWTPGVPYEKK